MNDVYFAFVRQSISDVRKIVGFVIFSARRVGKWDFIQREFITGLNHKWPYLELNQATLFDNPHTIITLIFGRNWEFK
jgi:hypothetical protein